MIAHKYFINTKNILNENKNGSIIMEININNTDFTFLQENSKEERVLKENSFCKNKVYDLSNWINSEFKFYKKLMLLAIDNLNYEYDIKFSLKKTNIKFFEDRVNTIKFYLTKDDKNETIWINCKLWNNENVDNFRNQEDYEQYDKFYPEKQVGQFWK